MQPNRKDTMTKTNNRQFKSLDSINFVRDLTPETAANYSGGRGVPDITLTSGKSNSEDRLESDGAISDLREFGFNNNTGFIANNSSDTWRFYESFNFKGDFIEIGPHQARVIGDFGQEISSFRAVD